MGKIKEKFDGLKQNFTAEKREYRCTYLVNGIVSIADFPSYFRWDCKGLSDPYARITGLDNSRQLGPTKSEMTATYSTLPASNRQSKANRNQPANPLARAIKRRWSSGYIEIINPTDLDGKAYCASSGQPFSGGLPIRVPYAIKTYIRNEPWYRSEVALDYIWHTDSNRRTLCTKLDGSEEFIDANSNVAYVEVTYEFWCLKSDSTIRWEQRTLDAGSFYLDTNGKKQFLKDDGGTKAAIDGGILLDGSGHEGSASSPKYRTFRTFEIANFGQLGLPT